MSRSETIYDLLRRGLLEAYTKEEAFDWLFTSHPQLDGRSAIDVIDSGDITKVIAALERLNEEVYL